MKTRFCPQKPKTISEVCGKPPGSFHDFILVTQAATRMIAGPERPVTLSVNEVAALLREFPELAKYGAIGNM